ncbi:hypothetical protein SELMODRAFT_426719 [Selaginella moellendorffii]|uniref:Uncharacterized protein n=1 Tax=Selaginella moellendorffii TaxID=88036 RepID=D8SX98_SELML|nr:hypothetical protein SELMODRAFT_426719 [Selaginella moellendorffii]
MASSRCPKWAYVIAECALPVQARQDEPNTGGFECRALGPKLYLLANRTVEVYWEGEEEAADGITMLQGRESLIRVVGKRQRSVSLQDAPPAQILACKVGRKDDQCPAYTLPDTLQSLLHIPIVGIAALVEHVETKPSSHWGILKKTWLS